MKRDEVQTILLDFFGSKDVLGIYSLNYSEDELRHYFLTHANLDIIPDDISNLNDNDVSAYLETAYQFIDEKDNLHTQEKSRQFRQLISNYL
jgi:uncharacterized radical SAM superfamily protein